jgi:hypothetical protein
MMKSVKDPIDPHHQKGVYETLCSCGKSYIGETGRSFQLRINKHEADILFDWVHASVLAEHSHSTRHQLCLKSTRVLATIDNHSKHKFREAIEIVKHPNNLNRDGGWDVNGNWILLLHRIGFDPNINHNNSSIINNDKDNGMNNMIFNSKNTS